MESNAASPACVLVVDDNRDAADSLAMVLTLAGYRPLVAYDGSSALTLSQGQPLRAAVVDLGLPVMDGCEVGRRLRAAPGLAGVVLIALTGHTTGEVRRLCGEAGFDHFLLKPADMDQLLGLLPPVDSGPAGRPQH
jgi:DNA-binding response OmpR family regulator